MARPKILVIDDESEFTDLLKMNLGRTEKYEILIENNSAEAVLRIRSDRPDVVLLDINMPSPDGGDILARLRNDSELKHIPVILVSALVSDQDMGVSSGSQREVVVAKPVNLDRLRTCIEHALGNEA